jgi:hypothetical protein
MPRIRSLKPEHRQHRKVGGLDHATYRLWVGMICEADDEGRLVAEPEQLRVLIFGYHPTITAETVSDLLAGLQQTGLVRCYSVRNVPYLYFPSWNEHQKIDRPKPSKLPVPPQLRSTTRRRSIVEPSSSDRGGSRSDQGSQQKLQKLENRDDLAISSRGNGKPTEPTRGDYTAVVDRLGSKLRSET